MIAAALPPGIDPAMIHRIALLVSDVAVVVEVVAGFDPGIDLGIPIAVLAAGFGTGLGFRRGKEGESTQGQGEGQDPF